MYAYIHKHTRLERALLWTRPSQDETARPPPGRVLGMQPRVKSLQSSYTGLYPRMCAASCSSIPLRRLELSPWASTVPPPREAFPLDPPLAGRGGTLSPLWELFSCASTVPPPRESRESSCFKPTRPWPFEGQSKVIFGRFWGKRGHFHGRVGSTELQSKAAFRGRLPSSRASRIRTRRCAGT